jgi:hypothetical protein
MNKLVGWLALGVLFSILWPIGVIAYDDKYISHPENEIYPLNRGDAAMNACHDEQLKSLGKSFSRDCGAEATAEIAKALAEKKAGAEKHWPLIYPILVPIVLFWLGIACLGFFGRKKNSRA